MGLIDSTAQEFFNAHWSTEMGAIDGHDLRFVESLLMEAKPKTVVEIGCATGLSTCMMSMMLEQQGQGAKIHSFDLSPRFYGDPAKKTGYLLDAVPAMRGVEIELTTGRACLAVPDFYKPQSIDFCFIDAAHANPWPAIDTLAVLPLMKPGGYIVHHDLQMFWGATPLYATGPKVLYELLPNKLRVAFHDRVNGNSGSLKTRKFANNIYAIRVPEDLTNLSRRIGEAFCIGWDRKGPQKLVPDNFADAFAKYLSMNYPPYVSRNFRVGQKRYDAPVPGAVGSLARRVASKAWRMVAQG